MVAVDGLCSRVEGPRASESSGRIRSGVGEPRVTSLALAASGPAYRAVWGSESRLGNEEARLCPGDLGSGYNSGMSGFSSQARHGSDEGQGFQVGCQGYHLIEGLGSGN
eukprot:579204-Rhodomonas_salina.3